MGAEAIEGQVSNSGLSSEAETQANGQKASRKRRFRRAQSAPGADLVQFIDPRPESDSSSQTRSATIFRNLHPSLRMVLMILVLYVTIGTVCFYLVRNQIDGIKTNKILDAVYFTITTMTTVGYGDLWPDSDLSKLLSCACVFSGMGLMGLILGKAANYLVEKQEALLVKAMHMRAKAEPIEIMREIRTNRVRHKCYMMFTFIVVLIFSATMFLNRVENLRFMEAFYCICATITTLGYGKESFRSAGGRVFAVFWILISTISLAQFFLYIAELNSENAQRALVNWVLTRRVTNADLEAADLDGDGVVNPAEFVVYKLKEMGKITQEDISLLMEEFEELDVDQSGTLTKSDLNLGPSSQGGCSGKAGNSRR